MKKALITALVLASSSVAMADVSYSASASINVGTNAGRPAVIDHRTADPCDTPAPVVVKPVAQPVYQPLPPVYVSPKHPADRRIAFWNPNNTTLGADSSSYAGGMPLTRINQGSFRRPAWWVAMTDATRIDRGREFFSFGAQAGNYRQIQLSETRGRSHIQQVAIEFADGGRTQVVKLDRDLLVGQPFTIDLTGNVRQINRIVVYGSTDLGAAYQILGM